MPLTTNEVKLSLDIANNPPRGKDFWDVLLRDLQRNAMGLAVFAGAPVIVGGQIGERLGTKARQAKEQGKSPVGATIREAGQIAKEIPGTVAGMGKDIIGQYGQVIRHPVKSFQEQPLTTVLTAADIFGLGALARKPAVIAAKKLIDAGKLTKAQAIRILKDQKGFARVNSDDLDRMFEQWDELIQEGEQTTQSQPLRGQPTGEAVEATLLSPTSDEAIQVARLWQIESLPHINTRQLVESVDNALNTAPSAEVALQQIQFNLGGYPPREITDEMRRTVEQIWQSRQPAPLAGIVRQADVINRQRTQSLEVPSLEQSRELEFINEFYTPTAYVLRNVVSRVEGSMRVDGTPIPRSVARGIIALSRTSDEAIDRTIVEALMFNPDRTVIVDESFRGAIRAAWQDFHAEPLADRQRIVNAFVEWGRRRQQVQGVEQTLTNVTPSSQAQSLVSNLQSLSQQTGLGQAQIFNFATSVYRPTGQPVTLQEFLRHPNVHRAIGNNRQLREAFTNAYNQIRTLPEAERERIGQQLSMPSQTGVSATGEPRYGPELHEAMTQPSDVTDLDLETMVDNITAVLHIPRTSVIQGIRNTRNVEDFIGRFSYIDTTTQNDIRLAWNAFHPSATDIAARTQAESQVRQPRQLIRFSQEEGQSVINLLNEIRRTMRLEESYPDVFHPTETGMGYIIQVSISPEEAIRRITDNWAWNFERIAGSQRQLDAEQLIRQTWQRIHQPPATAIEGRSFEPSGVAVRDDLAIAFNIFPNEVESIIQSARNSLEARILLIRRLPGGGNTRTLEQLFPHGRHAILRTIDEEWRRVHQPPATGTSEYPDYSRYSFLPRYASARTAEELRETLSRHLSLNRGRILQLVEEAGSVNTAIELLGREINRHINFAEQGWVASLWQRVHIPQPPR